jgi:hypothetical protein
MSEQDQGSKPNMRKAFTIIGVIAMWSVASPAVGQSDWVAKKRVRLTCSTLPYVFDCEIPLALPDPQFSSRCFYVAEGQSTLMRADHRMGFTNQIVSLQVNPGLKVTGVVTEASTGNQSDCTQDAK